MGRDPSLPFSLSLCASVSQLRTPGWSGPRVRNPRRNGVGLLVVLAVLALLGGAIVASMSQTGGIVYETQRLYRQACVENLQASGAAWARANRAAGVLPPPGKPRTLDAAALDVPDALLTVEALPADANGTPLRITGRCGQANRSMEGTITFVLPVRATPGRP